MCSDPQEINGYTVACRNCNECISTRRHNWVARAMAEKSDWAHAACIALTYSDETQFTRDGAAMFRYADVSDFMKRLRSAAAREAKRAKWNFAPVIRFICAGEQGSRNGRCHWHLIIYSNFDLARLGQFRLRGHLVSHRRDLVSVGKRKRRLNWTLWPHGFMTLQEPDQGAMNYVLSYCLKDQFTEQKAQNTMRHAKAENFATGLFRMSKRPAIGENFVMRKMEGLLEKGACLPALKMTIPGFRGYWQPSGSFRKKLLWCLVALNKRILWATGANAPQWSSLLQSCAENPADLEVLNGPQKDDDETSLDRQIAFRQAEAAEAARQRQTRDRCGQAVPCRRCLNALSEDQLRDIGIERRWDDEAGGGGATYHPAPGTPDFQDRFHPSGSGVNPLCGLRGTAQIARAFLRSGRDDL